MKRVILNYGPNGRSRGSATVMFHKPTAAAEAVKYDGTKVDGRPMRVCSSAILCIRCETDCSQIEVLMTAKAIPATQPAKSLADRVS